MKKDISILGIPMDMGGDKFGARFGPDTIRLTGLKDSLESLGHSVEDLGNVEINNGYKKEANDSNMKNLDMLLPALNNINKDCDKLFKKGSFPLILGGDHTLVLPTVKAFLKNDKNTGLIYVDAHADINTEKTSFSGNVHGMPVAALLGLCDERLNNIGGEYFLNPKNIVYIAIRDIDDGERKIIDKLNIKYYTMSDIYKYGIEEIVKKAFDYLDSVDNIYTSFDIDSIDMDIAPGTGVPVRGGLDYNMARNILSLLGKSEKVKALEFVEVSPIQDINNKTAEIAKECILSFFGKRFI